MRCEICGSVGVPHCPTASCGIGVCPVAYGPDCVKEHNKKHHPEKEANVSMARQMILEEREKAKTASDRAVKAEGDLKHQKMLTHALAKWLKVMSPSMFEQAKKDAVVTDAALEAP